MRDAEKPWYNFLNFFFNLKKKISMFFNENFCHFPAGNLIYFMEKIVLEHLESEM